MFITTYYNHKLHAQINIFLAMLMMFVNVEEIENFQFQVQAENLFYTITTNTNTYKNLLPRGLIEFY
jgi:hypothetical protein